MNLFELWAKIGLDPSDYEQGVKKAMSSGERLEDSLKDVGKRADRTGDDITALGGNLTSAGTDAARFKDDVGKAERSVDKLGDESDDTSGKIEALGNSFDSAAGLLKNGFGVIAGSKIFGAIADGLSGVVGSTEEYRLSQIKLNTAFENAGYTGDIAKNTYKEFYKILGDNDRATEASQILANMNLEQEDLAKFTDIAAGVYGRFGDSLPIESLMESANETAKTGEVTGALADALNWAGASEDDFNEKLKACSTEEERNKLIVETLNGEYQESAELFEKNNESVGKSREEQVKLQEALSDLGGAVSDAGTTLMEKFTPYIADAAEKAADFIESLDIEGAADTFISSVESAGNAVKGTFTDYTEAATEIDGVTESYDGFFTTMKKADDDGVFDAFSADMVDSTGAISGTSDMMEVAHGATKLFFDVAEKAVNSGVFEAWDGDMVAATDATGGFVDMMNLMYGGFQDVVSMDGTSVSIDVETDEASKNVSGLQKQLDELKKRDGSTIRVNVAATGSTGLLSMKDPKNPTAVKNAGGLDYVPYNDFPSMLHQGEMVLTKPEADTYRRRNSAGGGITIIQNISAVLQTPVEFAAATEAYFEQARWAI